MEKEEKKTASGVLANWIAKNSVILIGIIAVVVVVAVVLGVVSTVNTSKAEKGFTELDNLYYQLTVAQNKTDATEESVKAKEAETLSAVYALADANSRNAVGSRAYLLAAELEFKNAEYAKARDAYLNAAAANEKAYTAPLCWYNAAICAEELGDVDGAIANIEKAVARADFVTAPRAMFNAGRMEEQRGNYAAAKTWYNRVNDKYVNDNWANLAKSRLISLDAEGKN